MSVILLSVLGSHFVDGFIPRSVMVLILSAYGNLDLHSRLPHLLGRPRSTGVPALQYTVRGRRSTDHHGFPAEADDDRSRTVGRIVLLTAAAIVFSVQIPAGGDEGEAALEPSVPVLSRRAVDLVDPDTHRAFTRWRWRSWTAGVVVDGQAGR